MLYMQPRATVALVGVATLNLALPAPPACSLQVTYPLIIERIRNVVLLKHGTKYKVKETFSERVKFVYDVNNLISTSPVSAF